MQKEHKMPSQNDRLRVLLTLPAFVTGGAERVVLDLLRHLDRNLFEVAVVSLFPASGSIFEREVHVLGVEVFYLSKQPGLDIEVLPQLNKIFASFKPDIVHNHLYILHYILPLCVLNNTPVRIHTFHNTANIKAPELWRRWSYYTAIHQFGFMPVSVSAHVAGGVQQLYHPSSSFIIRNGTDTAKFSGNSNNRAVWRKNNSISEDAWVLACVARLHHQKNHNLLLDTFAGIAKQIPQALLLLAGSGPLEEELSRKTLALGLQEKVRFLGDRDDLDALLQACDVAVSTSNWEGLSISLIEAMAAGKPIVATNVGGVPELVKHSTTGFLVPSGDQHQFTKALLVLQANPELAHWMGEQGRQRARAAFDVREMARQYGQLYLELFDKSQRGQRTGPTLAAR
jgi:glycosyltransferase involved in cell wall biosynthesis